MTEKLTPHQAAQVAARARWSGHPTASVRLSDLSPAQRRLVLALVNAAKEETSTVIETSVEAQEVRRVRDEHPTAA